MRNKSRILSSLVLSVGLISSVMASVPTVDMKPLSESLNVSSLKGQVKNGSSMPQITWAEDMRTILANGNSQTTKKGSLFDEAALTFNLELSDSFVNQSKNYISGKSPFFRGTMDQVVQLNETVYKDPDLRPVVLNILSWSQGGDSLVVSEKIKNIKDLKGKRIAAMAYGPHVFFVSRTLKSAGLTFNDVEMIWVKDLVGTESTSVRAFCDSTLNVDAAFTISTEAFSVIEGDNSCKGAHEMFSTKQASKVIADVIAVRSDYFNAHKDELSKFVHTQMIAKEKADVVFADKNSTDYKEWISASAKILFGDSSLIEDAEGMFELDAAHLGYSENALFFNDQIGGRNFKSLTSEINDSLIDMKLINTRYPLAQANWDWSKFQAGLKYSQSVATPAFDSAQTKRIVNQMQANNTLDSEQFLTEEIKFDVGESTFSFNPVYHAAIFNKIIDESLTYSNTLVLIQAHSDPSHYLIEKYKYNKPESELKRIRQKAWNLSVERAKEVRQEIIDYALKERGISLDESQFEFIGYGFEKPLTGICGNEPCKINLKGQAAKEAYGSNRRAVIGFTRISAEKDISADEFDF